MLLAAEGLLARRDKHEENRGRPLAKVLRPEVDEVVHHVRRVVDIRRDVDPGAERALAARGEAVAQDGLVVCLVHERLS